MSTETGNPRSDSRNGGHGRNIAGFATTCWSEVRRAGRLDGPSRESLESLCRQYWYPLYAFLRRSGHGPDQAQDHVQSFFSDLLSRNSLAKADPSRGRFRTFLLTACKHHVSNRLRYEKSLRRGGTVSARSLETDDGEQRYSLEPADHWTPETLFDRRWALAVIDAAFHRVRDQYVAKGRAERFDQLRPLVAPSGQAPAHSSVAEALRCSPGAVKVAAHRLRQQFAAALRDEIANTLETESEYELEGAIEDELNQLMAALRGKRTS